MTKAFCINPIAPNWGGCDSWGYECALLGLSLRLDGDRSDFYAVYWGSQSALLGISVLLTGDHADAMLLKYMENGCGYGFIVYR